MPTVEFWCISYFSSSDNRSIALGAAHRQDASRLCVHSLVFANPHPSLRAPPHHCEPHPVFASAAKQSTSQTTRRSTMDCHVATLLAETEARHCELHPVIASTTPSLRAQRSNPPRKPRGAQPWTAASLRSSQRRQRVIANSTPSLRTPPRHCERSEAIHLSNHVRPAFQ